MFRPARIHKNVGFVGDVIFSWRLSSNPQLFSLKMSRTVIALLLVIIIQLKVFSGFLLIVGMALASSCDVNRSRWGGGKEKAEEGQGGEGCDERERGIGQLRGDAEVASAVQDGQEGVQGRGWAGKSFIT